MGTNDKVTYWLDVAVGSTVVTMTLALAATFVVMMVVFTILDRMTNNGRY